VRALLGALLYFPSKEVEQTPADHGLEYRDVSFQAEDRQRLHGWLVAPQAPLIGHILFCHGNAGNIADRIFNARLLCAAGFEVLLFDYRGYGYSTGTPDEQGTYRDARAARAALLDQPGTDPGRMFYLGESLGGAIALCLALASPPRGLILQSAFSSIRQAAGDHYPFIPSFLIPDIYPSLRRIYSLDSPLLVLHGDRDDVVGLAHGQALFNRAKTHKKRLHVFDGASHNDLPARADYARTIADWVVELD
jgi:pimeloyl-ACP methyl ester carboxylesterase